MKKWTLILVACLALVAAGCGDDDDDSGDSGGSANTAAETTGGGKAEEAPAAGAVVEVSMKNVKFVPADITVKKGQTVKWTNDDGFAHTVTKKDGPGAKFDSGNVNGGGTFEQKFDTPGTVNYFCELHSGQTGKITVK